MWHVIKNAAAGVPMEHELLNKQKALEGQVAEDVRDAEESDAKNESGESKQGGVCIQSKHRSGSQWVSLEDAVGCVG